MMGQQTEQKTMFSYSVDLDKRVRAEHPLRQINEHIDFTFVRQEVKDLYGFNGNESVDPSVVMKMMFLLFFDDVPSERELMKVIGERLDYMWFLGYGLDDVIPHHSVLSKARKRWGVEIFERLFTRVVAQCQFAGLIEGKKLHMDGSLVNANASNNAIVTGPPELIEQLRRQLQGEMIKLDEVDQEQEPAKKITANKQRVNTTDPDAVMINRGRGDRARARYKTHRAVDNACGVITATETTSGDVDEAQKLIPLVDQHEQNTGLVVETVIADSAYGTLYNFRACQSRNIGSHMGDRARGPHKTIKSKGLFAIDQFIYDPETDTYMCPAGQRLHRTPNRGKQLTIGYRAGWATCTSCSLRHQCNHNTKNPGRVIRRHPDQHLIDEARRQSCSTAAKRDRIRRKWLMEGSFADAANNHGFKRSRWRRLWRQQIQDYMIAATQNIRILMKATSKGHKAAVGAVSGFIKSRAEHCYTGYNPNFAAYTAWFAI